MNKLLYLPLVVILLLAYSCAVNTADSAGSINGKPISLEDFYSAYRGHYTMFSYQNGRSPDKDEQQAIFKDTWLNITRAVILKNYYQKYKISATVRETIDTLSNNVPPHIVQSKVFQTNGKFDKKLYLQSLLTDKPENLAALRKQYQEYLIPNQKLQHVLVEKELISKGEADQIGKILTSKADLVLNIFDPNSLEVVISDNEINSYYQTNLLKYRLAPYCRLAYCYIPVVPDEEDYQTSKAVADSICALINNGTTAEELIHSRSQYTGMISLTDHGYVKTTDLPEDLQQLLANIADGTCTNPIREDKGWVIHQKVQSTKTLTLYKTINIQSLARAASLIAPETTAKRVRDLSLSLGLKKAADEFNLKYIETERMTQDSLTFIATDMLGALKKKLKTAPAGYVFEPLFSSELSAWLLIAVVENQTKDYQSIDEVRDSIRSELLVNRRSEQNLISAKQWVNNPGLTPPANMHSIALGVSDVNSVWNGISLTNVYYQSMKAHLGKTPLPVIEVDGKVIVPVVSNLQFTKEKVKPNQIRDIYVKTLPVDWFNKWLDQQVTQAKVVINANP
jgi:hypothetical protein